MQDRSAIVLAGGRSRRMGRDKAWVELAGEPLLARVVRRLADSYGELLVVASPGQALPPLPGNHAEYRARVLPGQDPPSKPSNSRDPSVAILRDEFLHKGPLGGLYTGLKASTAAFCPVVACDMPFVDVAVLRYMTHLAEEGEFEAVAPVINGVMHPLHGVYGRSLLPALEDALGGDLLSLQGFLVGKRCRYAAAEELAAFDPLLRFPFNVNSPADLEHARSMLQPGEY